MTGFAEWIAEGIGWLQTISRHTWLLRGVLLLACLAAIATCSFAGDAWRGALTVVALLLTVGCVIWPESFLVGLLLGVLVVWAFLAGFGALSWLTVFVAVELAVIHITAVYAALGPVQTRLTRQAAGSMVRNGAVYAGAVVVGGAVVALASYLPSSTWVAWVGILALVCGIVVVVFAASRPRGDRPDA